MIHWRQKGQTVIELAGLLDSYILKGRQERRKQDDDRNDSVVQAADEALRIAAALWLWQSITEARSTAEWEDLAHNCELTADGKSAAGKRAQALVWLAVAGALYEAAQ